MTLKLPEFNTNVVKTNDGKTELDAQRVQEVLNAMKTAINAIAKGVREVEG